MPSVSADATLKPLLVLIGESASGHLATQLAS
jgi:hypothetical protein